MVVDLLRPQHAHDAMVDSDERHGEQIGDPVLAQRQERQHDEEVEVRLDVAPREVHEDA